MHWVALASSALPLFLMIYKWNTQVRKETLTRQQALDILGITEDNPTTQEIKRAYKKKATTYHPDKGGDEKQFKQLGEARDFLLK